MLLTIKAKTIIAKPRSLEDRIIIKNLVYEKHVIDYKKTRFGVTPMDIFDPIPYNIRSGACYLHSDMFNYIASGVKFKTRKRKVRYPSTKLVFDKSLVARDYQVPVMEKLLKIKDNEVLGLTLATGRGKTFTICSVLSKLDSRVFIYIKAEYVEKWVADVKLYFNLEEEEYIVIKGAASLREVLTRYREDFYKVKIFIVAMQTFKVYIKNYLENKARYKVRPENFLKHIGASVMVVDEGHEYFENVYRTYAVLAPLKTFILTATMYNIDPRVERYLKEFIPEDKRVTDGFVNKHANVVGVKYTINNVKSFTYGTFMGYSHIMFEKSLRRRSGTLNSAFEMYGVFLDMFYMKNYQEGDKAIIFFSAKETCYQFVEFIKNRYKDKKASMYIQGHTFETVLENDILATTIGKMGSAIDIPNLTTVLQTVVVSSRTKNEQTIGRLRPMEGRELTYIYFNSISIDKHRDNLKMRSSVLGRVANQHTTMRYNIPIG